ncbi:UNVERIFIED_CONTAM: hypothetical protein H355_003773, partial [Colinus virginianus]
MVIHKRNCISAGYLKGALGKWPSEHQLLAQRAQVESMVKKLSSLLEKATHSLVLNDPKYFKEFAPILGSHFWVFPHSWNQTDTLMAYSSFGSTMCFTERMSDTCFTYLLGTWKENGKSCTVTSACRNTMTQPGCSNYCLSHQLLYFIFADVQTTTKPKTTTKKQTPIHRKQLFLSPGEETQHSSGVEDRKKLLRRVKRREKMFA